MISSGEKIWDGRGDALEDARLTIADGRLADDLRLGVTHFRVMAHVGRQNARRGWLRVSQTELATRWECHRNTVNRAFLDLVRWGYLSQRTQKDAGESFCLYKVALDGESDAGHSLKPAANGAADEYTPESAPPVECTPQGARGSAPQKVHMCTAGECTGAQCESAPPYIRTDKPTNAENTPPTPRGNRRRGRECEVTGWFLKIASPERRRVADDFLRPLLADVGLISDDPVRALGALADEGATVPAAVLAAALKALRAGRGAKVKPFDIRAAIEAARKATPKAAHPAPAKSDDGNAAPVLRIKAGEPSFAKWLEAAPEKERPAIEAAGEVSASARWPRAGARLYAPVAFELGAAA